MRFASIGGSNAASYAAAGKAVADSGAKMFKKQRETGPDYAGLSKVAMQTASNEKIAGMQAEAKLTNVAQDVYADQTQNAYKIKVFETKEDIKNSRRKAGGLAAIGKIAAAGFLSASDNTKDRKYPTADRTAFDNDYKAKRDALLSGTDKQRQEIYAESDSSSKALRSRSTSSASTSDATGDTPGKVTEGSSNSPAMSTYQLSGNRKIVADAVAGPESGAWNYEAFNQGGGAGGTSVLGKSGSHKEVFGRSLTDHTLGEIYHKQNTKQRGLSLDEHMRTGGLHAVGRYQFIGSTLQDEARRMGLSPDTKFTPEVQDNIFFSHIKRVGNISPWVGPSTKWDQNKKNQINSLIPTL
jgi:hypothetical protein